jgi:hypothetical protein
LQLFQNISYLDLGKGEMVGALDVAVEGAGQLIGIGVARWKAWPAVEKCLLQFSIIVDLLVVTVFPSLSSWEEVLLFSMDFTVSQKFFELVLQDANFCLKKLALAFLTAWELFDANAERHRMFLRWSWADRSGVNQGLYIYS